MIEHGPEEEQTVLHNRKRLDACDLILFTYDSSDPNSFAHVAKLRVSLSTHKPFLHPTVFYLRNGYFNNNVFFNSGYQQNRDHTLHLCRN
jgi:hypothetical protein